jgi:hypothetical protein
VTDESKIATHANPVGRDRTNHIVRLDLSEHGMPGRFEQCWTRTEDQRLFELCCIPFFTYGQSLGDLLAVELGTGRHKIHSKSGHRTIRFAFTDDRQAHDLHPQLHGALIQGAGCLVEYRNGGHYGAIDIDQEHKVNDVIDILTPLHDQGGLVWEWADPPPLN